MKKSPANGLRRKVAGACLVAAPLLMLAGDALRLGAGQTRTWLVMFKFSFALFAFAALGVTHMLKERADRTGLAGGALTIVGCLAGSGILTAAAVTTSIESATLDAGAIAAIESAFKEDEIGGYVLLYPLPGLAFPLGLLVLAVGLWRARVARPSVAALMALGAVLFPVGRIGGFAAAVISSGVALSLGMGLVGLRALAWSSEEWERVPEVGADAAIAEGETATAG